MKILFFTYHYPSPWEPTKGTYNLNTFRALARHADCQVVASIPWWYYKSHPRDLARVVRTDSTGIPATFIPYWSIPRLHALHARAMFASSYLVVKRVFEEHRFDAIVSTWAYPDCAAAVRLGEAFKRPVISTVLGSDVNDLSEWRGLRPQIIRAMTGSKRVLAVSAALGERVIELGVPRSRMVVRRNGVDGEMFSIRDKRAAREKLGVRDDRRIIVYVGNIKHEKGTDVLVEAMKKLTADHGARDVELSIVGSGELEPQVRPRVEELGLSDFVVFRGRRLYDEVPTWMAAADVFVLPSRREGCPNVILEALASGRPVVASRVGGIPELLNDRNGIMFEAGDAGALASALADALARQWDPEALRGTVEALSWNDVGDTYRDVLVDVLKENERN